jgi:hypothetical protein
MKGRANKFPGRENELAMVLNLALVLGAKRYAKVVFTQSFAFIYLI